MQATPGKGRLIKLRERPKAAASSSGEIVEDRAVGSVVAVAGGDESSKRVRHRPHLGDASFELANMGLSDALDLTAWTGAVAPEGEQSADFGNRKPSRRARRMNFSSWTSRSP